MCVFIDFLNGIGVKMIERCNCERNGKRRSLEWDGEEEGKRKRGEERKRERESNRNRKKERVKTTPASNEAAYWPSSF